MKIVIALDSFKGSMPAAEACRIVADALTRRIPAARVSVKPMADGGEGTAKTALAARKGQWVRKHVMGPLPDMKVRAGYAWFQADKSALVEMAAASGLELLAENQRNPLKTTTYGTGQLIAAAAARNPRRILLAVGGSATVDGGVGAAVALGWRFLGRSGKEVGLGGGELQRIEKIVPPRNLNLPAVQVLCDVQNRLCGARGAARVFAPQKGATPQMVARLEKGLAHLSKVVRTQLGTRIDIPGAGAAGGLSAGAVAFMRAELTSGAKTVMEFIDLDTELADADWVITGEGCFDRQSPYGKVVSAVVEAASKCSTDVAVIAGQVLLSKAQYQKLGVRTAIACKPDEMPMEQALRRSRHLLRLASQRFAKEHLVGG
jgi:glycerate kinase